MKTVLINGIECKKVSMCYFFWKRFFDIFLSLIAILLLSWLFLLVLIINCFFTKFHPVFIDKRIGKHGKTLRVLKYRSMKLDAENNPEKYFSSEQYQQWLKERKVDNDPRITKFGKFLRKTSLDEILQLFNVLFGGMSLVGPRPIAKIEISNYTEDEQNVLLSVRPGLTGYWQVYARSLSSYEDHKRQDIELSYFKHRSLFFDFGLILKTVPAALKCKGAE